MLCGHGHMIAREIRRGRSVRTCWTRLSLGSAGEGHQTRGELEDMTWAGKPFL